MIYFNEDIFKLPGWPLYSLVRQVLKINQDFTMPETHEKTNFVYFILFFSAG